MWSRWLRGWEQRIVHLPNVLFPIVYAVIGGATIELAQRTAAHDIVNSYEGLQIALLVVLGIVLYMVRRIMKRIDDLHKRSKLAVDLYESPADALGAARKICDSLPDGASIRAVNSFVEADTDTPQHRSPRRQWYTSIEERIGGIDYHRIIQLAEPDVLRTSNRSLYQFVSKPYIDHFRKTLATRSHLESSRHTVRLDAVPARYPLTFGIFQSPGQAPGGVLFVQINQYVQTDRQSIAWRMAGAFVIRDPDGQFVPHFESLFANLANSERSRPVTMDELEGPLHSASLDGSSVISTGD